MCRTRTVTLRPRRSVLPNYTTHSLFTSKLGWTMTPNLIKITVLFFLSITSLMTTSKNLVKSMVCGLFFSRRGNFFGCFSPKNHFFRFFLSRISYHKYQYFHNEIFPKMLLVCLMWELSQR